MTQHEEAVRLAVECGGDARAYLTMPGRPVVITIWADNLAALIAEVRKRDIEIALRQRVAHECSVGCCDTRQTVTAQRIADDISARLEEGKA